MNHLKLASSCRVWQAATVIALFTGASGLIQAQEMTPRQHRKVSFRAMHENGNAEAYNWSGYAVAAATAPATPTTSTGVKVTTVSGSWVVPTATCTGRQTQYAAFWIGIDGWYSDTVEQIGTDSDCSTGTPTYYAWYEFYPEASYYACSSTGIGRNQPPCALKNLTPGDVITASVVENTNGTFTATISAATSKGAALGSFSTVYTPNRQTGTPQLSSAEWIAEAPCCTNSGGTLPLANFGSVTFANATATVNGVKGSIGSFYTDSPATWWACAMVDQTTSLPVTYPPPSNELMALPGSLLNNGSSFVDTWYSVGP